MINKNTGHIVCDGGQDVILDQITGKYRKTRIKDTNREYVIDMWSRKPRDNNVAEDLDITRRKGEHFEANAKWTFEQGVWKKKPIGMTIADYVPTENNMTPFTRQP